MTKPKSIWLVSGGPMQLCAARRIKDFGYNLIVSDRDPHCACIDLADYFIEIDTRDSDGHVLQVGNVNDRFDVSAVFTTASDSHFTVARLAQVFGLHGLSPFISHKCLFKNSTRQVLSTCEIPQPRMMIANTYDNARAIIENEFSGACVIKSCDNSGSRGFSFITDLSQFTEEIFRRAVMNSSTSLVIIEEILEPITNEIAEQSVETFWFNGQMFWLNWVDRLFRDDLKCLLNLDVYPPGVEIGHLNPAIHSEDMRVQTESMIERAGRAIGMDEEKGGHILKADVMQTVEGPVILELTPRLSGGWDSSLSTIKRGGDFVGGAISMALGERSCSNLLSAYFRFLDEEKHVAILSDYEDWKDCSTRQFYLGVSNNRQDALDIARFHLKERKYVLLV